MMIKMKKTLLLMLLFPILLLGQKKEAVYKKLANLTCDCAAKKAQEKNLTSYDLGICIFDALDQLDVKDRKTISYNPDKKIETGMDIAKNVGVEMAIICPNYIKITKDEDPPVVDSTQAIEIKTIKGSIDSMVSNGLKFIYIIDDNHLKKEFLWLDAFEGDSLFIKGKAAIGDSIEIQYIETNYFDPKENTYRKYNVISSIKLL